ncbi:MAG TPA: hypothetical protein VIU93_14050 [Gallionellaceae bacterium]
MKKLDAAAYFDFNLKTRIIYTLTQLFIYRKEKRLAKRLFEYMDSVSPLSEFTDGMVLGMIHGWEIAGDISPPMHALLQILHSDMTQKQATRNSDANNVGS